MIFLAALALETFEDALGQGRIQRRQHLGDKIVRVMLQHAGGFAGRASHQRGQQRLDLGASRFIRGLRRAWRTDSWR